MSQIQAAIIAALLALLLSLNGCSTIDKEAQLAFAERSVTFVVWGIYCINQACGIGYISYQRNPVELLTPASPADVLR
jgi:hypothetical protein